VGRTFIALHDVSLTLSQPRRAGRDPETRRCRHRGGESVAVVGPSGSGKTSLLMIVGPAWSGRTSGSVQVAGHDFMGLGEDELAVIRAATSGIVFQSFHLVPTMTALENVALRWSLRARRMPLPPRRPAGRGRPRASRRPFPGAASGGEQQRSPSPAPLQPRAADHPRG